MRLYNKMETKGLALETSKFYVAGFSDDVECQISWAYRKKVVGVCTVPMKRFFLRTVIAKCLGIKIW